MARDQVDRIPSLPARRGSFLREVEMLARLHTSTAIDALVEIVRDRTQPAQARVSAADAILDRGWGRAPMTVAVQASEDVMSDEELDAAIRRRVREIQGGPDARVVQSSLEEPVSDDQRRLLPAPRLVGGRDLEPDVGG